MTTRTTTGLIGPSCAGIMLALAVTSFAAAPTPLPPGHHLSISNVLVEFDPTHKITIDGSLFDFGSPLVVTFDDSAPLNILSFSATQIVVECPPVSNVPTCAEGDYLLTVSTGIGQSQNDEYDLTIGAVGPQGPIGNTGPIGPQGTRGDMGPTGDRGPQGSQGSTGADGGQGPAGGAFSTFVACVSPFQPGGCTTPQPCNCGGKQQLSIVDGPCFVSSDGGSCKVILSELCAQLPGLGSCCVCRND